MRGSAEDEAAGSTVARIDGSAPLSYGWEAEGRTDYFEYILLGVGEYPEGGMQSPSKNSDLNKKKNVAGE